MKTISKSQLKSKMLEFFRQVESSGEELIVTDFGRPVLKIVPFKERLSIDELFKDARANARISRQAAIQSTADEWGEI